MDLTRVQEYIRSHAPLLLQTYSNQVGGHSPLMLLGDGVICKPVIPREKFFYETASPAVRHFTPCFHGTVRVRYKQSSAGDVQYFAYPFGDSSEQSFLSCSPAAVNTFASSVQSGKTSSNGPGYVNPWSVSCLEDLARTDTGSGDKGEYILLENLTGKFISPSIIDLKMGTRQHGDDSSQEKKELHTAKCASSTSLSLGVRICGMQIYDSTKRVFTFQDKYVGRKLDAQGFHATLRQFLFNGRRYRMDLVPDIVKMLKQLRRVISEQDSYRFFSSSLLVVYEGSDNETAGKNGRVSSSCSLELDHGDINQMRKRVDVRMIDFAHTTHQGYVSDPIRYQGPDNGYILGLTTLIDAFERMVVED